MLAAVALPCAAAEEPAPSLELLLHLAEFSDASGEPIAPQDAAAMMDDAERPRHAPAARDAKHDARSPHDAPPHDARPQEKPHDRD